jgi:uncharacterized protein (DUF433 family)
MEVVIQEHIEITPGICGGKPRIAGQRIRVMDIAIWHEKLGLSPDEIVSEYPTLTLADVYAALAYYFDHREEIQADIARDRRYATTLRRKHSSLLLEKLKRQRGR